MNTKNNKTSIPAKGDNFDFIGIAEPLRLPLTDMECGLISALFMYSELKYNGFFINNGVCFKTTDIGEKVVDDIFTVLMSIANTDDKAIDKMNEYTRLEYISRNNAYPPTREGGAMMS